ncbi:MAG: hypothetical protein JW757_13740 [Anaerolineales bacterium]|nr:hypothetical protein [Anaerolineales bacterium]
MTKIQRYPTLDILPAENIRLHEHHDPQRTSPLKSRIDDSGVLYNPPIVIPFSNGDTEFMVLDGANRVTSLKELGVPHLLVQIVDPDSPGLSLQTWNHVIWGIDPQQLIKNFQQIQEFSIQKCAEIDFTPHDLACIQLADGSNLRLSTSSPEMRSDKITEMVNLYGTQARFDRTMIEDIRNLDGLYDQLAGLVIYPQFSIEEVVQFCRNGRLLPAGVTRFIVSPRALRVNYPLGNLCGDRTIEEKREILRTFIQDRLDKKGVRIYTETTVLYDE